MTDPLIAGFFANTYSPSSAQIDFLTKRNGVSSLALSRDPGDCGFILGAADVAIDGDLFDFAESGNDRALSALVIVARDRSGDPLDLVAWAPRSGQVAALYGRAAVIGEQTLYAPRVSGAPQVHRTIVDWLRAERDGVVVVRPSRAACVLLDAPGRLLAADEAHARDLAALFTATVDLTRIVIPGRRAA